MSNGLRTSAALLLLFLLTIGSAHSTSIKPEVESKRDRTIYFLRNYNVMCSKILETENPVALLTSLGTANSCTEDFMLYFTYIYVLMHSSKIDVPLWVLELLDATGKPQTGILEENMAWLGSFSECLKVQVFEYNSTILKFKGQYCTAIIESSSLSANTTNNKRDLPSEMSISLGVCWPSSCTAAEIAQQLNDILKMVNVTDVGVTMDQETCYVQEASKYSFGSILLICVLVVFGLLMLFATLYEVVIIWRSDAILDDETTQHSKSIAERMLLSFSVYKNGKKILDTAQRPGTLGCIHGIRFFSMTWVILGHTYASGGVLPFKNWVDIRDIIRHVAFDTIMNGSFSVDTFFFLSGFLVAYLFLKEMKKTGGQFGPSKIFLFYFHRYWRLTPALGMVIAIVPILYENIETGPEWRIANELSDNCQKYLWRNLIYVQNLYDLDNMCFGTTWYLACDMQFYLISLLIIYPLYRYRTTGLIIMSVFFVASMLIPGLILHFENINAIPFANMAKTNHTVNNEMTDFQADYYIKPWCRMGPYIVGIALAVVLNWTSLTVKLKPIFVAVGWLLSTVMGLTLVYGTHDYFTGDSVMSNGLSSVYGASSRTVWAIVVAWVVFACVTGHGGYVNSLLSWKALIPLSRLTYCCYLVHIFVLLSFFGSQENVFYFTHYLMVILFLGMLTLSMLVAFVFSLAFEAPMMELEKIFLPGRHKGAPSLLYPQTSNNPADVIATIQSSSANQTAWRPPINAYQNEGFKGENDVDTRPSSSEDERTILRL